MAQYTYDSWGKLISIVDPSQSNLDVTSNTSHIGYINPLRYRGYYFDVETGLYYLNARYYDPETGRFISADDNLIGGLNLYEYCGNDPLNLSDHSGRIAGVDDVAVASIIVWVGTGAAATVMMVTKSWLDSPEGKAAIEGGATAIQDAVNWISDASKQTWDWTKNWLTGGSTPANPNDPKNKRSLKKISSNKEANKVAKEKGYKDAEALKADFVFEKNVSSFNMMKDTGTGEIVLQSIKGNIQVSTGLFV